MYHGYEESQEAIQARWERLQARAAKAEQTAWAIGNQTLIVEGQHDEGEQGE